jgi:hypothetical protein
MQLLHCFRDLTSFSCFGALLQELLYMFILIEGLFILLLPAGIPY